MVLKITLKDEIIDLSVRASIPVKQVIVCLFIYLSVPAMDSQTAWPNGLKFGE